jgi:hypothetical protein
VQGTGVGVADGFGVAVGAGPVCGPTPHAATNSANPITNAVAPR